jgi:hypothetical protein
MCAKTPTVTCCVATMCVCTAAVSAAALAYASIVGIGIIACLVAAAEYASTNAEDIAAANASAVLSLKILAVFSLKILISLVELPHPSYCLYLAARSLFIPPPTAWSHPAASSTRSRPSCAATKPAIFSARTTSGCIAACRVEARVFASTTAAGARRLLPTEKTCDVLNRYYCVPCGGGGICGHNRRRDKCPDCKKQREGVVYHTLQAVGSDLSAAAADKSQFQQRSAGQPQQKSLAHTLQPPASNGGSTSLAPAFGSSVAFPSTLGVLGHFSLPIHAGGIADVQAHSTLDSATSRCETMLKNWSQSLMAHTMAARPFDLQDSHNYRAAPHSQGAFPNTSARAVPPLQSDPKATESSVSRQCLTSSISHKFVVVGDAVYSLKGCNCKLSNCLKGYCECHAAGARCTTRCRCMNCDNGRLTSNADHDAIELAFKKSRLESPLLPATLEGKFYVEGDSVFSSKGCNCKHSHCLKRYCECHAAGARCTARCKCLECQNGKLVDNAVSFR